ncbi:MAG: glycoside hydrolase family 127 protein [Bacteroidia bacterium]|nr:glycoside hydrolase family 127 protein [Bacteroidia bacterium]
MDVKRLYGFSLVLFFVLTGCTNENRVRFSFGNADGAGINHVCLLDGPFRDAQQRDLVYLKSLNPDRLLATFRQTAGLQPRADGYKGWEEREVRGHFTGHYLSACSMLWAATGDTAMKGRVLYITKELKECQQANGDGYISAFPREFIDRVESIKQVWAPYYTIHKILAGLIDAYTWCADTTALEVACGMADWINSRCQKLPEQQMQEILDHTEQGGMNEALFQLYSITGKRVYKDLAGKFYQNSYFIPLADYRDTLKGQHVNSFIPNVIGLARGYELTGDLQYRRIAEFFWKTVTETRSFVTGGTSNGEIWSSDNWHIHSELGLSSHESCCTYNMLKLTRHLWRWKHDPAYSDYYERALWNGILPTQHPVTGMSMYYVPMAPGFYKTFGTPENSFWCCTGTGVENFARVGECIYSVDKNQLYVDQYISSELRIDTLGFSLKMDTRFPEGESIEISIGTDRAMVFGLNLRIPGWVAADPEIRLNGKLIAFTGSASSYFKINRKWKNGDRISVLLPMSLRLESMPDAPDTCAVVYGPVVLAGRLGTAGLDDKKTYGQYGPYEDKPIMVPDLLGRGLPEKWIRRQTSGKLVFKAPVTVGDSAELVPFYQLFDQRYAIYWKMAESQ